MSRDQELHDAALSYVNHYRQLGPLARSTEQARERLAVLVKNYEERVFCEPCGAWFTRDGYSRHKNTRAHVRATRDA